MKIVNSKLIQDCNHLGHYLDRVNQIEESLKRTQRKDEEAHYEVLKKQKSSDILAKTRRHLDRMKTSKLRSKNPSISPDKEDPLTRNTITKVKATQLYELARKLNPNEIKEISEDPAYFLNVRDLKQWSLYDDLLCSETWEKVMKIKSGQILKKDTAASNKIDASSMRGPSPNPTGISTERTQKWKSVGSNQMLLESATTRREVTLLKLIFLCPL